MRSCAGGAVQRGNPRTKLHRLSSSFMDAPNPKLDFKTVDDSLARHCPLQIHADLIGELLLPHSITRASGEAGPSPEQEALSGLPRLVVELFHRRTQFYTLV